MKNIEILRPNLNDVDALSVFFKNVIADTYVNEGVGDLVDDIEDEVISKNKYIQIDLDSAGMDRFFLLAKHEGKIIGTAALGPVSDLIIECSEAKLKNHIEIGSVLVDPSYQKQGVASLLMNSIFIVLMARNVSEFCLDSGYREAKKVWVKRFGQPDFVKKDQWGKGKDHYVWSGKLSDVTLTY